MNKPVPTWLGIIILVLVAALAVGLWQIKFWEKTSQGEVPVPPPILTGEKAPSEITVPSPTTEPGAPTLPRVGKPGEGAGATLKAVAKEKIEKRAPAPKPKK